MTVVAKILQSKPDAIVHTIAPQASVLDALRLMADKGIGALVVTQGDAIVGIVTERDYARKIILQGKTSKETQVREIMSDKVAYVTPAATLDECRALMTEKHFRHLPVLNEDGSVAGMVSIGDLVKETISSQQFIIAELERYIAG